MVSTFTCSAMASRQAVPSASYARPSSSRNRFFISSLGFRASPSRSSVAGTECRASAGPCDVAESCTGSSATCPPDAKSPAGTVCRPAANQCDVAETCDGTSNGCRPNVFKAAGSPCGSSSTTDCDRPDTCDGLGTCNPNFVAAGTPCTPDANDCTLDQCDGAGTCTHPVKSDGSPCTPDANDCTQDVCL